MRKAQSRPSNWPRPWGLETFYDTEGPWIPPNVADSSRPEGPRGRPKPAPLSCKGRPAFFNGDYRNSNLPSECDTVDRPPLPSDSGYGTRLSEPASVYGDMSHETASIQGHLMDYHITIGSDTFPRDTNLPRETTWPNPSLSHSQTQVAQNVVDGGKLICPTCKKPVKTKSELKLVLVHFIYVCFLGRVTKPVL
jgi:hypothetical protein